MLTLANFLVILGSQHPFSFNFYFMLISFLFSVRVNKVVVVVVFVVIGTVMTVDSFEKVCDFTSLPFF